MLQVMAASGSATPLEAERSLVVEGLMARMLTRRPAYRSVNGESDRFRRWTKGVLEGVGCSRC